MSIDKTPGHRNTLAMWWLLQELEFHFLSSGLDTADIELHEPVNDNEPSIVIQRQLLKQLVDTGALGSINWRGNHYSVFKDENFEATYKLYRLFAKDIDTQSAEPLIFKDETTTLYLGTKKCKLPPYKYEHLLCQVMFQYKIGESVDVSSIYESMMGEGAEIDDKARRMLKDTVYRINERAVDLLGIPVVLKRDQNTIQRVR